MFPDEEVTRLHLTWPWWRWSLTGLSAVALSLSAYLACQYLKGGSAIGCGPDAPGCDQVLSSRWSTVGGVLPVSGLATGVYLAMLVASLFIGPVTEPPVRRLAWRAMLALVGAAAGSAVWFSIVQTWIIGAFCPYCMATHVIGLLLTALVLWRAPLQINDDSTDLALMDASTALRASPAARDKNSPVPGRLIRPSDTIVLTLVGVVLAGIMAASQVGFAPQAVYRAGQSQVSAPSIDPRAVPLVGSPDAPYIVNLLFDYKCPHCQQLHFMLNEAIRRYRGRLAFALRPTPLNRQCNPYIPHDVDEFKDSCELAKVGLAVWVAKREAFAEFEHWMFSFESGERWHPRSLDAAKAKAVELVGQANFASASSTPWIDRYMQTSIRIYAETLKNGNGAIPKLVFGSRWVIPEPQDPDDLVLILQNSLAMPKP